MKHKPEVKPRGHTAKAWRTGKPGATPKIPSRVRAKRKAQGRKPPLVARGE